MTIYLIDIFDTRITQVLEANAIINTKKKRFLEAYFILSGDFI